MQTKCTTTFLPKCKKEYIEQIREKIMLANVGVRIPKLFIKLKLTVNVLKIKKVKDVTADY